MTPRTDSWMLLLFSFAIAVGPPGLSLKGVALSVLEYEKGAVVRTTPIRADAPFAADLDRLLQEGRWKPSLISYAPGVYVKGGVDKEAFGVNVFRSMIVVNYRGSQRVRKIDEVEYRKICDLLVKSRS